MVTPKVEMQVKEHDGWYYAFLECKELNFTAQERMPDQFLSFNEEQRNYWGAKLFSKMEKKLSQHMKKVQPFIPPKSAKEKRKEAEQIVKKQKLSGTNSGKRVRAQ